MNTATSQGALCAESLQALVGSRCGDYCNARSWVCVVCGEGFQIPLSLIEMVNPVCGTDGCRGKLRSDPSGNTIDDLT